MNVLVFLGDCFDFDTPASMEKLFPSHDLCYFFRLVRCILKFPLIISHSNTKSIEQASYIKIPPRLAQTPENGCAEVLFYLLEEPL